MSDDELIAALSTLWIGERVRRTSEYVTESFEETLLHRVCHPSHCTRMMEAVPLLPTVRRPHSYDWVDYDSLPFREATLLPDNRFARVLRSLRAIKKLSL